MRPCSQDVLPFCKPVKIETDLMIPPPPHPLAHHSVHLVIREKLSCALNRDGGLDSLELKGDLDLRISTPEASKVVLSLSHSDAFTPQDLQFKTHPRIDKKAWGDAQKIQLRDLKQGFPVRQGLAVLKWRLVSKDESIVPLSSECVEWLSTMTMLQDALLTSWSSSFTT